MVRKEKGITPNTKPVRISSSPSLKELNTTKLSAKEAREYAESIINAVREPLIVLDRDLRVVSASRSFYEVFKVKPEDTVGQLIYDLGNKQWNIPKLRELLETVLPQKAFFDDYEVDHDFTTIGQRIMLLNARRIPRPPENLKVILLAIEDITERKKIAEAAKKLAEKHSLAIEKALVISEETLRLVMDPLHVGIALTDLKGTILNINKALILLYGSHSQDEVLGKNILEFVEKIDHTRALEKMSKVAVEEEFKDVEFTILRADGSKFQAELSASIIKDAAGVHQGIMVLVRDISERKKTEEDLKRSEKKYATIVEKGNDGIIVIQDGVVVFSNFKMAEMIGFSLEEILGKSYLDFIAPDNRVLLEEQVRKRMKGESVPDRYETTLLRKSGEIILVEVSTSVIEHDGRPGAMGIIRDVTEKRKLLEQLMAQDRLASVGLLVAGVAHELNNPLTSVIGFSELLLKRELPEDAKDDIKIVNDEAKRAALIVKNLLIFARKQPEGIIPFDVNQDILGVMALRVHEQKVSNIEVNLNLAPDLPQILGNSSQLQQVFINIIINAEQSMLDAHNKGTLIITSEQVGNIVRVSFADDGPGISPENMKKLFTPFFTTKEVGKGTGLGLSICHGIITDHGGKIYAESELGKGATFIVELPLCKNPSSPKVTN